MQECPCRYCGKRQVGCHGICTEYKEWSVENENLREKIRERNRLYGLCLPEKKRRKR